MSRDRQSTGSDAQERFDVLLDIGRVLPSTLEPGELYRTLYEQASRLLDTTGFYIALYEEEIDLATVVFYADRGVVERPERSYRGSESRAIRERRPILEEDRLAEQAILLLGPDEDEELTRSALAVPLIHEGRLLGVMSAQSYRPGAYTRSDLDLLGSIGELAAVALWNARTVQELELRRLESEKLEEVSRALTASLDLPEVLQRIAGATLEVADADGAAVWLLQPDGRAEVAVTEGEVALPVGTRVRGDRLRERLERDGRPVVLDRSALDEDLPDGLLDLLEAESAIAVPLVAEDDLIGALSVSHAQRRQYDGRLVRLLHRLAHHAAVAVGNARLHDQVRTLSLTDPLTRLPNRRHMEMFLAREFAAAERGRSLAVVLFDLNDFKRFNDSAGHQAGDAILRRFGQILATETRAMNLAARYGGDEFICILSDTDEHGGAIHAGRVYKAVHRDPEMQDVGVSAGVAVYDPAMVSPDDLIRKADAELYRAKAARKGESRQLEGCPIQP